MVLHHLGVHQATDIAAHHPEEVGMAVGEGQGQMTTRTFREHPIPDQGHQLQDVEAEADHIRTQGRHPEHLRGEEEAPHLFVVRRGEGGEAQAIAPTVATAEVAVELEADPGVGKATREGDECSSEGEVVLYVYQARGMLRSSRSRQ